MRILSVLLSVCLSVRLSDKRVDCDKTEERSVQKDHLASFSEKNGWWGRPLLPEILGEPDRAGAKSPILNRYSLVAP